MEKGLVTVVLPIYNVERYLDRCMKSVTNQTYKRLEIIMVDDESPDSCPQMCEEWAQKDHRIKVVHKKNAGLGMARNTGIDHATGEFICFFDSDDYIAPDAVEQVYKMAVAEKCQLVLFGYHRVGLDGKIKKSEIPSPDTLVYRGEDVQKILLPNIMAPDPTTGEKYHLGTSAWSCMYSMELIQRTHWRFVSERQFISEDRYSMLKLYKDVTRVGVVTKALYYYCDNGASLTHTYNKDRFEKNKYCYDACMEICREYGYTEDVKKRLSYQYVSNVIGALKLIVTADCGRRERYQNLVEVVTDHHLQAVLHNMDIHKETLQRKMLFISMRKKLCRIVYGMVKLKS